jgi:putative DNA primase/helicase
VSASTGVLDALRAAGLVGLDKNTSADVVEAGLRSLRASLNGADSLRRAMIREEAIVHLEKAGLRAAARAVDAAFGTGTDKADGDAQGKAILLSDPEPWPEPVDGVQLVNELLGTFTGHLVLPNGGAIALALWTLHAHTHDAAVVSPILAIKSATKRTGKTSALTLQSALVPRPLLVSNVTPATVFRTVEAYLPTLLIDEADSFLGGKEELRGLLNSGHTRAGAVIVRSVGKDFDPRTFSTWCPKAIALIGDLPATLEDRAIVLTMRRRSKGESVKPIRLDRLHEFEPLRRRAARWAQDNMDRLRAADPNVPTELHDRAADNWRPLLAIADLCGSYADEGRWAALLLTGQDDEADTSLPVLLLADLRQVFEERATDRLSTAAMVDALVALEERPWGRWAGGKGLTGNHLSRLLRPFGIKSTQVWIADSNRKGYTAEMFLDAWGRYLADAKIPEFSPKAASVAASSPLAPLAPDTGTDKKGG